MGWREHLKIHPACDLLPAMTPEELRALSDDIKANTLQERAKLIRDGDGYEMIDGRSRMDALDYKLPNLPTGESYLHVVRAPIEWTLPGGQLRRRRSDGHQLPAGDNS